MEQNNRGVQLGCYSVALIGFAVSVRKVRPFAKFKKPSSIPDHFIKERRELVGIVEGIEPNGSILMVKHQPLVNLPFVPSGQLPVKISGVEVSGLGFNWLQAVVSHQKVKFIPIAKDKHFVRCQVLLMQNSLDKKGRPLVFDLNLGEKLVKIGFASPEVIEKPLSEDNIYLKYYNLLQKAEKYAQHKQLGLKYYIKPTKKAVSDLYELLLFLSKYSYNALNKGIHKMPKLYVS
ncbi:hypothetical protein JTB14_022640 [Gonioctena quinquepunctata]|nr:hypothetical protein JTB14_022640 [Gonioctena quinquepunctata]